MTIGTSALHWPIGLRRFLLAILACSAWSLSGLAQSYFGNVTGYSISDNAVILRADTGAVRFVFYRPDVIRVDFLPSLTTTFDSSLVVIRDSASGVVPSILQDDATALVISSASVIVVCQKAPLLVRFYDSEHRLLLAEGRHGGFSSNFAERSVEFSIGQDEHYYGTGERGTAMDRHGQAFSSYNTQIFGYTSPLPTMNINIPFVASSKGYGIYFENTYPGQFDFGQTDPSIFSYSTTGGELSYYLFAAPTVQKQIELYTWLTGRQPLPPRWAFGFIQSRFGYASESEARTVVQTMRQKQIPCDAIVLDLYWFSQMGDISWNRSSWPDPFGMMNDFLATGIKTIVITEPYITQYSMNFSEAVTLGVLTKDVQGNPYLLDNWWSCGCNAGLIDMTSPASQQWWWNKHPSFFGNNLAGIWTDLGEPERHPAGMLHAMGSAQKVHNVYNLLWAKTIFEGFSQLRPGQRLFNLTRSGYAGIQRYGVIPWSGDVGRSFGGLAVQPAMMLSMGLSGLAYHNSDIGGFTGGGGSAELYARWMEYGTFCPITRAHGAGAPTEPWGYGAVAESIAVKYLRLRYQLLPYIYSMAHENYATGRPLARPLFFDDPANNALANESSSYLLGDAFVVSPVVEQGATTRAVTLPAGRWVNYWTDQEVAGGGSITVAAPLETLPLFVRSGSIIPMQPVMDYSDQRPLDTLMLEVYPFGGDAGTFALYEDDGKTLDYQMGAYSVTGFSQSTTYNSGGRNLELSINPSAGSYDGKPLRRTYLAGIHGVMGKPDGVTLNGISVPQRSAYDSLRLGGAGYYVDDAGQRLYIQIPTNPDSAYRIIASRLEVIGAVENPDAPEKFHLLQNYPNPFNPSTTITYTIGEINGRGGENSTSTLKIFDVLGREVTTLVNAAQPPGTYKLVWDARTYAAGTYILRLTAGSYSSSRVMMLVK
jgi:alpha-glucosidase (family GH31 glycosyl hydrolase)